MPPKKNVTPTKQPEYSSMTYEESEDMLFRLSGCYSTLRTTLGEITRMYQGSQVVRLRAQ